MRFLGVLTFLVLLVAHQAKAETNLVWSPTGTNRDIGTWQCATDSTPVLTGSSYSSSTIAPFGPLAPTANVYQCFVDRPIGSGAGCPPPNYTQEGMAPKSQARLCQTESPPPPTPQPSIVSFRLNPVVIAPGEFSAMEWVTKDMQSCTDWNGVSVALSGALSVTAPQNADFGIKCLGLDQLGYHHRQELSVVVPTVFVPPPPPPCMPTATSGITIYEAVTVDGHSVKVWSCDEASGFVWRPVGYDPSQLAERLQCIPSALYAALSAENLSAAWVACVYRPLSVTEKVVADVLTQTWKPRFEVQFASNVTRRPVYTRNEDGTRGVQLRLDGVLQYILVREPCNGSKRLLGISTRYHLVSGRTSQQGQVLPPESYAQCSRLNPPEAGWPAATGSAPVTFTANVRAP